MSLSPGASAAVNPFQAAWLFLIIMGRWSGLRVFCVLDYLRIFSAFTAYSVREGPRESCQFQGFSGVSSMLEWALAYLGISFWDENRLELFVRACVLYFPRKSGLGCLAC